ncbi:MAG: hypothetical protein M1816_006598 [Peltula sp. TS41687]|nr:MAG: hypothetical protein M1816_006598 [Peltula sp. TS41687]
MDLQALPVEVVDNICSFLQPSAIASLRRACRWQNGIASRHLIDTVYVDMLPESIHRLFSTAAHPIFRHTVRAIYYFPLEYCESFDHVSINLFKNACKAVLCGLPVAVLEPHGIKTLEELDQFSNTWWWYHMDHHAGHRYAQKSLFERLATQDIVAQSLTFPNIDTVAVSDSFGLPVLTTLMRQALEKVVLPPMNQGKFTAVFLRMIFSAASAELKIKRLHIYNISNAFGSFKFELPDTKSRLAKLEFLHLNFILRCLMEEERENLKVPFRSCLNLRSLELLVTGAKPVQEGGVLHYIASSTLRSVVLDGLQLDVLTLIPFVMGRQPTLGRIILRYCHMKADRGSVYGTIKTYFPGSIQRTDEEVQLIASHS